MTNRAGNGIKPLIMSGDEKKEHGCIVVFSDGTIKHFCGEGYLQAIADFADQLEVKISVISTPSSIYRDMQGTRKAFTNAKESLRDITYFPEPALLAQIKRHDLL